MAMTLEQTRQAIIDRMKAFTGITQDRIQYPNLPGFNVPKDDVWCRLTIAGGPSFTSGIADKPCTRRTGNIMIQCFDRLHTGEKALTILSDALLGHFEYYSIDDLECLQGESIYAGKDADFIQYNVSISYLVN
ncbi:phage tail terminator-like protein [Acinetobacter baumannii]|uniref:phage tail terminator-like protein n=1 Tax=Acinetobacter baumannii TaxID=470 RepID=UPI0027424470|nr:phage tail terminator-like protein [Acinetobacter baumannii]MDP7863051.1 phage tail terminator-like protein [Acinetobacter baumannii]